MILRGIDEVIDLILSDGVDPLQLHRFIADAEHHRSSIGIGKC